MGRRKADVMGWFGGSVAHEIGSTAFSGLILLLLSFMKDSEICAFTIASVDHRSALKDALLTECLHTFCNCSPPPFFVTARKKAFVYHFKFITSTVIGHNPAMDWRPLPQPPPLCVPCFLLYGFLDVIQHSKFFNVGNNVLVSGICVPLW